MQIFFQPVAGFKVEMVGGFIEQQQVGLLQQKFGQRQPHLPAAGEFAGLAIPILFAKPQAHQHPTHVGFDRISPVCLKLMLEAVITVGDAGIFRAGVIELGDAVEQRLHLQLHGL